MTRREFETRTTLSDAEKAQVRGIIIGLAMAREAQPVSSDKLVMQME